MLAGCASRGVTLNDQMADLTREMNVQGKVRLIDPAVDRMVWIQKVVDVGQAGPKLQVFLCNRKGSVAALEYAWRWFDRGALLDGINQDWVPVSIQANDCAVIQVAAPLKEASHFELLLKKGSK